MLKTDDIRKKDAKELINMSTELRAEIAEIRRRIHLGETQNSRVLRVKRRDHARVLTILGEQLSKEKA